jgi:Prohead core protein serine protease
VNLLTEDLDHEIDYLVEGSGANQRLYIEGIFAQAEVANKNKRVYPLNVLVKEVRRYTTENINSGRAWGELGHPTGPNINLDRACILIKEMNQDRTDFYGKALVCSTPMGDTLKGLMESGGRIGVSTRALGSLKAGKNGLNEVQADLRLLVVDVVADPSAPKAFVNSLMENSQWVLNEKNGQYVQENVLDMRRRPRAMSILEMERNARSMFAEYISKIERT